MSYYEQVARYRGSRHSTSTQQESLRNEGRRKYRTCVLLEFCLRLLMFSTAVQIVRKLIFLWLLLAVGCWLLAAGCMKIPRNWVQDLFSHGSKQCIIYQ